MERHNVAALAALAVAAGGFAWYFATPGPVRPSECRSLDDALLYDDGSVWECELRHPRKVSGVPCRATVELWRNGQLHQCRLSADLAVDGGVLHDGMVVTTGKNGTVWSFHPGLDIPGEPEPTSTFGAHHCRSGAFDRDGHLVSCGGDDSFVSDSPLTDDELNMIFRLRSSTWRDELGL